MFLNNKTAQIDQVTVDPTLGGQGDGSSFQKTPAGTWSAALPTPGSAFQIQTAESSEPPGAPVTGTSTGTDSGSTNSASAGDGTSANTADDTASPASPPAASSDIKISCSIILPSAATALITNNESIFHSQALGALKQPLLNARYIWNFGDGATAEGETVSHAYDLPGTYFVALTVASGKYSAFDQKKVTVVHADLIISAAVPGEQGYVEITNNTRSTLDLSVMSFGSDGTNFSIPDHTYIAANSALKFSAGITSLVLKMGDAVVLRYSNGQVFATSSVSSLQTGTATGSGAPRAAIPNSVPKTSTKKTKSVTRPAGTVSSRATSSAPIVLGADDSLGASVESADATDSGSIFSNPILPGILGFIALCVAAFYFLRKHPPA